MSWRNCTRAYSTISLCIAEWPRRDGCEFFTVTYPHGPEPVLEMTDKNIDNYRKALSQEIAERREWVEPIVSVLALLCSIAALVISLVK